MIIILTCICRKSAICCECLFGSRVECRFLVMRIAQAAIGLNEMASGRAGAK